MASGGHTMQQQRAGLETRIKSLVNNDLKEICKAYNYQVSGTKAVLQKRCIESEPYSTHLRSLHRVGISDMAA